MRRVLVIVTVLAALGVVAQTSLRPTLERSRVGARTEPLYAELETYVPPGGVFQEAHPRCFNTAYEPSWIWSTFDQKAYAACLDQAYQSRLRGVATLEVGWRAADPAWLLIDIRIRVAHGELPSGGEIVQIQACGTDEPHGESSNGLSFSAEERTTESSVDGLGVFKETVSPPCHATLRLRRGRWQLAEDVPLAPPMELLGSAALGSTTGGSGT